MLASELLRRLVPSGASDVAAIGGLGVTESLSSRSGLVVVAYKTANFDLVSSTLTGIPLVPAIPGFYGYALLASLYVVSGGPATCTTGPTVSIGNNAAETNFFAASAITAANINGPINAGFPSRVGSLAPGSGAGAIQLVNLSTPITAKLGVAAAGTGGFALSGFLILSMGLIPV